MNDSHSSRGSNFIDDGWSGQTGPRYSSKIRVECPTCSRVLAEIASDNAADVTVKADAPCAGCSDA